MKSTFQEKAYCYVLNKIKQSHYKPGMALKEEVLAREIGVSATPVREAFRRLEREGWVENKPYKGCFLKEYTLDELKELCILRESVEVACVTEIIKNIKDSDWKLLNSVINESEKLAKIINNGLDNQKKEEYEILCREQDSLFHSALIKASHCKKLVKLAETWNIQIQGYAIKPFVKNCNDNVGYFHYVVEQHKAILISLKLGWDSAARELIRAHISTAFEHLLTRLNKEKKIKKNK